MKNSILNATKTAKAFGKRVDKWKENSNTVEYLEALSNYPEKGELKYIVSKEGRYGGTWIHKKLIIVFARWLSPEFAVWCDEVIEEILQTGSYSLQKEETQNEKVSLQKSLETVETGIKLLKSLSNLNPMEKIELDKFYKIENGFSLLEKFGISFENSYFLPTEIGNMIGMSGAEINLILEKKGFQFRDENGVWKPTEKGLDFCLEIGNKFNQLKWRISTIL
jgi:hypothetical protein